MRETTGDLWRLASSSADAWVVLPTNGARVRRDGSLVMGAGVAGAAKARWPHLPALLGAHVAEHGNTVAAIGDLRVLTWPTKPDAHTVDGVTHPGWMCAARIRHPECLRVVARLVWGNAPHVVAAADRLALAGPIFTPRVGCGLGGLDWAKVGPALARVLDDRFVAVTPPR